MKIWMKRFRRIVRRRVDVVRGAEVKDSLGATAVTRRALAVMANLQSQEANRAAESRRPVLRPSQLATAVIFADAGDVAGVVPKVETAGAGRAEIGARTAVESGATAVWRREVLMPIALSRGALRREAVNLEPVTRAAIRVAVTLEVVTRAVVKGAARAAASGASGRVVTNRAADRAFSGRRLLLQRRRAEPAATMITGRLRATSR